MSTPQPAPKPSVPKFSVTEAQTKAFSNAWDSGGIKMIMDATSVRFATAWANIVLQSAYSDPTFRMQVFTEVLAQLKAAKQPAPPTAVAPPAPPAKSSIILTD